MLLLVLGNNYLVMFVGWEGVGLCSYLLIGFYFEEEFPPARGQEGVHRQPHRRLRLPARHVRADRRRSAPSTSASVVRRDRRRPGAGGQAPYCLGLTLAGFVALCLFVGATGKSAQIPLYVWLPDAMAGPTPVSALIHAATMVTAGVYMVARSNVLYQLAPAISLFVAVVGARHGALRRDDRPRAERHQEGARLLDRLAARLHVPGRGRWAPTRRRSSTS